MTAFLVDTCVFSELCRSRPAAAVAAWADRNFPRALLPAPVIMEFTSGLHGVPEEARRSRLLEVTQRIANRFPPERRIVFDEAAARAAGQAAGEARRRGRPLGPVDAQLIGLAHSLNVAIASRDADFADRGVALVNPWEGA